MLLSAGLLLCPPPPDDDVGRLSTRNSRETHTRGWTSRAEEAKQRRWSNSAAGNPSNQQVCGGRRERNKKKGVAALEEPGYVGQPRATHIGKKVREYFRRRRKKIFLIKRRQQATGSSSAHLHTALIFYFAL